MLSIGLAVAFGALISFTLSDFFAKRVASKWGSRRTTFLMLAASLATMLAISAFTGLTRVDSGVIILSGLSGMAYALAGLLLYRALEVEQVSNTISLVGIEYALIIVFSVALLGESVNAIEVASFLAIFIGTFLATAAKKFRFDRGYTPAIAAMVTYAIAYMLLVFAWQGSGGILAPLIINRIVAVAVMAIYMGFFFEPNPKFRKVHMANVGHHVLASNALVGIFNGIAVILLLLLPQLGFIADGSAIVAAEPALIIVLGYLAYRERFEKHQIAGLALLVIGTIVLSIA